MADDTSSYLSQIAAGFNKALGAGSSAPESEPTPCPHCGKDTSQSPAEDDSKTVGQRIGYPGS